MAPGQGLGRGAAAGHDHHAGHAAPAPDADHENVSRGRDAAADHETCRQQASAREIPALPTDRVPPLAAVSLPREINQSMVTRTACPALRIRRLCPLVAFGADAVRTFTAILMVGAVLGLFAARVQVLGERREDLAVMRVPGG